MFSDGAIRNVIGNATNATALKVVANMTTAFGDPAWDKTNSTGGHSGVQDYATLIFLAIIVAGVAFLMRKTIVSGICGERVADRVSSCCC